MKNLAGYNIVDSWGIPQFRVADFLHHRFRLKLALKSSLAVIGYLIAVI